MLSLETLRPLVVKHLLPMLPGSSIAGSYSLPSRQRKLAATQGPNLVCIRPQARATEEIRLSRSQPFGPDEVALAEAFVLAATEVQEAFGKPFQAEVLARLPLRVVSRAAGGGLTECLFQVLDQYALWAARQYEGRPIVASVGLDPAAAGWEGAPLGIVWGEPFAPVLTNGMDTILTADSQGRVVSLTALSSGDSVAPGSPYRYRALADYARDGRIAVALNRNSEVLIFAGGTLRFALRSGGWQHFAHKAVLSAIHMPHKRPVKEAIYETLLDVSFARTGGCLAVAAKGEISRLAGVVADEDRLDPAKGPTSMKGGLLGRCIGRQFHQIDRRIRAELLAMDGATIVSHLGVLVAAGAIVKIDGGSSGGGRLAAAKTLSGFGLGIKVSQDGGVEGFSRQVEAFAF